MPEPVSFDRANFGRCDHALFESTVQIEMLRAGRLDEVLLFFEAHLNESTKLSSAPWLTRTHWPQILYLSEESTDVRAGQSVKLSVAYAGGKGLVVGLTC